MLKECKTGPRLCATCSEGSGTGVRARARGAGAPRGWCTGTRRPLACASHHDARHPRQRDRVAPAWAGAAGPRRLFGFQARCPAAI